MASAIKLNYDCKALPGVVNYDHKCDNNLERQSEVVICTHKMFIITAHWFILYLAVLKVWINFVVNLKF